jgi:hypothetical protein
MEMQDQSNERNAKRGKGKVAFLNGNPKMNASKQSRLTKENRTGLRAEIWRVSDPDGI